MTIWDFSFRLLTVTDANALARIHAVCFSVAWDEELFRDYFEKPQWNGVFGYGAYDEKFVLTGFILGRTCDDTNDILTFAVDPSHQGQGIGRMVLDTYLQSINCPCLLEVSVENKAALSLYKAFGFETIAIRKDYYAIKSGIYEDAYVMKRTP